MCVSVCTVVNGDAFSITTVLPNPADTAAAALNFAATFSATGTTSGANAVCLYDFLLIVGGRSAAGVEADRYCGGALNPAPVTTIPFATANALSPVQPGPLTQDLVGGLPTSIQVCSKFNLQIFTLL